MAVGERRVELISVVPSRVVRVHVDGGQVVLASGRERALVQVRVPDLAFANVVAADFLVHDRHRSHVVRRPRLLDAERHVRVSVVNYLDSVFVVAGLAGHVVDEDAILLAESIRISELNRSRRRNGRASR